MTSTAFLAIVLGFSFFFIYTVHIYKTDTQILIFRSLTMSDVLTKPINHFAGDIDSRNGILPMKGDILMNMRIEWEKKDKDVKDILRKLNQLMPSITFTDIMTTTSARNSKATILNYKDSYCVGEHLMVRLDLYNYLGERKKYGGDFLRARIFSSSLRAGASGRITDYRNGTYLVNFTLFWEGDVKVSILLIHPSEGVSALWAARKRGYDKVGFRGKFLNGTSHVSTKCSFVRSTTASEDLCEYLDERDQEGFYCVKPKRVPCEALVKLQAEETHKSYLTGLERRLFKRNNVGAEILHPFVGIHVVSCGRKKTMANMNCRVGMTSPFPSGFVWQNQWHPAFCNVLNGSTLDNVYSCLQGKQVFLLGDSTMWQWIEYLSKRVSTLSYFDTQHIIQSSVVVDMTQNITIHWGRHGHPFVTWRMTSLKSHFYIARVIDMVEGDRDTVVAISLGQHFRPFPIELFIRRMINIRGAVQRLLLRSPDTRVIIKAENTRKMDDDQELYSNFHGYAQYLATKIIFRHLNVGFIDAWDMAIAYKAHQTHPPEDVVWNQIVMFLTHIC